MDSQVLDELARFARDVKTLPNETAKSHRFVALVQALFPQTNAIVEITKGLEHRVRIRTAANTRHGRIDAYFGNAIIEFETSLRKSLHTAERQLREYTLGVWQKHQEVDETLVCIASDGIKWRTYRARPAVPDSIPDKPTGVTLDLIREFDLGAATHRDFWMWLTHLLFRDARVRPTPEAFLFDFGGRSIAFADAVVTLDRAWKTVAGTPHAKLKVKNWRRYLTFAYGTVEPSEGIRTLFVRHTYLSCVAKFLVWASLSHGKWSGPLSNVIHSVFSGDFFRSHNIDNLVEDDFFQWVDEPAVARELLPFWERLIGQLLAYDLTKLDQDILKNLYQELVDPKDRHELGEYYTPDWLCERIVEHVLPQRGYCTVLDPACGSGGFLRATITHFLTRNGSKQSDEEIIDSITSSVVGIDIHPLAVTIARSTYALALGELVQAARKPVHLPVYLADSLFLPHEVDQLELGKTPSVKVEFGKKEVQLPNSIVSNGNLYDATIAAVSEVARDHARVRKESRASLEAFLSKEIPEITDLADWSEALDGLWDLTVGLADLIRKDQDSIWSFILRNQYRPAMLKRRFSVIVGNPPWLVYRFISDRFYQAEVKFRVVEQYRIGPKERKLFTQMELASVFLVHSLETFGADGARLAFVMPLSVWRGDQHARLRNRSYKAHAEITEYWDLSEVSPLFNVPACVVFATRKFPTPSTQYSLPVQELAGRLPEKNLSLARAKPLLTETSRTARVIWLGTRNAVSTEAGAAHPGVPSTYLSAFRQGATIVPRNCYFITVKDLRDRIDSAKSYWCETDPLQAREAKQPWKDVALSGHIEGAFIYTTILSRHVLPFFVHKPSPVFLPLNERGDHVLSSSEIRTLGYRRAATWMEKVEEEWNSRKGGKQTMTAADYLNYQGKLTVQADANRYLVVYNHSGTNISAAVVDKRRHPRLKIDVKLYWASFASTDEAFFVAGVLNSSKVNDAIKPFQSLGLQGERDVHKKPLELPIPQFQAGIRSHRRIAALAQEATDWVAQNMAASENRLSQQRRDARESVGAQLDEIDNIVSGILWPDIAYTQEPLPIRKIAEADPR
jgi:hypothetical protein